MWRSAASRHSKEFGIEASNKWLFLKRNTQKNWPLNSLSTRKKQKYSVEENVWVKSRLLILLLIWSVHEVKSTEMQFPGLNNDSKADSTSWKYVPFNDSPLGRDGEEWEEETRRPWDWGKKLRRMAKIWREPNQKQGISSQSCRTPFTYLSFLKQTGFLFSLYTFSLFITKYSTNTKIKVVSAVVSGDINRNKQY